MTHELKIQKQWADAKLAGEKPFEIRRNDRGFQKGDIVRYKVIDPKTGEPWLDASGPDTEFGFRYLPCGGGTNTVRIRDRRHPIERCDFLITYVREGADGLKRGYCVYADQPVPKRPVSAGLRVGTTPPAEAPGKGARAGESVPKSSDECKDFAPSASGMCVHVRWDVDSRSYCTCAGSERNGLPCRW